MNPRQLSIGLLVSAVFLLVGSAVSTRACVCGGTSSIDESFKEASAIFAGRFLRAEYRRGIKNKLYEIHAEMDGKQGEEYEVLVYVFEAKTWWKGAGTQEVVLISDNV